MRASSRTPPRTPLSPRACACALLLAALALSSCGGGSHSSSSASATESAKRSTASAQGPAPTQAQAGEESSPAAPIPSALSPSTVVARVGDQEITWAVLRHKMAQGQGHTQEVPEPPGFTACVAHAGSSASAGSSPGSAKAQCAKTFSELAEGALESLIHAQWVLGEGRERGLRVNESEAHKELAQATQGDSQQLASSGLTIADVRQNIAVQQIIDELFSIVKARTPRVTSARVAAYYRSHLHEFALPEERDIHIVRTASSLAAQKALEQIKGGESFAEVAKNIALPQPIRTINGTFKGLTPTYFSEPELSDAIFKARPHVLSGPIRLNIGYYDFEVIAVHPAHQVSLERAEPAIRKLLPELLHSQALSSTVVAYRKKWTSRTSCKAGFVARGCKEFKAPPSAPPPDDFEF